MLMGFQSFSVCGALRLWLYLGNLRRRDSGYSRLKWKWSTEKMRNYLKTCKNAELGGEFCTLISPSRCVIQKCFYCKVFSVLEWKAEACESSCRLRMTVSPAAKGLFLNERNTWFVSSCCLGQFLQLLWCVSNIWLFASRAMYGLVFNKGYRAQMWSFLPK